jgi:hypothetical protein
MWAGRQTDPTRDRKGGRNKMPAKKKVAKKAAKKVAKKAAKKR